MYVGMDMDMDMDMYMDMDMNMDMAMGQACRTDTECTDSNVRRRSMANV